MTPQRPISCQDVEELAGPYGLGVLEPAQADEVRAHLESHPDVHAQSLHVVSTAMSLSLLVPPVEPPAGLRHRVMEGVHRTPQAETWQAPQRPAASLTRLPDGTPVSTRTAVHAADPSGRKRVAGGFLGLPSRAWAMAAVVLLLALGGWNVFLQRDAADADHRFALLRGAVAAQADTPVAVLAGTEDAPGARGYAVLPPGQTGYIVLAGLPTPAAGQVWQAWQLTPETPVSAGLLQLGPDGLAILEGITPVPTTEGIALTLEPAGGSDAPTTTPVVTGSLARA